MILLSEISAVSELLPLISAQVSYFTSGNVSYAKGVILLVCFSYNVIPKVKRGADLDHLQFCSRCFWARIEVEGLSVQV
jgi:hypothetical protein